jgi:hypothetical protein
VRIDRSDEADGPDQSGEPRRRPDSAGDSGIDRAVSGDGPAEQPLPRPDPATLEERVLAHRATVDATYRRHAIDQGYARVEKLERETVTPAMRRIEAGDSDRTLVGMEHRLKGKERIEEKIEHDVQKKGLPAEQAFADMRTRSAIPSSIPKRSTRMPSRPMWGG